MMKKGVLLSLALVFLVLHGFGQICFQDNPINYAVSSGTTFVKGIVAGNFSGDTIPDVAVAYTNNIRLKVRNATGGFSNGTLFNIGPDNVYSMRSEDMDNDGLDDIVVLNIYCKLYIYFNNGNGTFTDSIYAQGTVFGSGKMHVEDVNNDGFKDVLMLAGNSTVFLSNGARNYQPLSIAVPFTPDVSCIGNWNNDSFADLLLSDNGVLTPLIGNGNGTFTAGTNAVLPFNLLTIALADMNNDGTADVITTGSTDVIIHTRNSTGNIVQTTQLNAQGSVFEYIKADEIIVADLLQDQYPEIILSSQWNSSAMVVSNINGVFNMKEYACTGGSSFISLEDMDDDGLQDIVTASSGPDGYFSILMGNASGLFVAKEYINTGHGATLDFQSIGYGDLNGDGYSDLITYGYDTLLVLMNDGAGGFSSPVKFSTGPAGYDNSPVLIDDFSNDGFLDVIVGNYSQEFYLFKGQGNGNLLPPVIISAANYTFSEAITSGNFNNDTIPDIAYGANGLIKILLNNGNGTFSAGFTFSSMNHVIGMVSGDFNEDGFDDLVFTNQFSSGSLYLNNGSGVFTSSSGFASCALGSMAAVACGDLNRDGHLDIAFADHACGSPDRVLISYGDGAGLLSSGGSVSVYESPYHVAIADINLDGYNDIVSNSVNGFISVNLYNQQTSGFSTAQYLASGALSSSFIVNDLNNDNKPDFAYCDIYGKDVGVTLNSIMRIYPDGPHFICNGNSVMLYYTDTIPGLVWSNGETNDTIYVNSPGVYFVTDTTTVFGECFASSRVFVQAHTVTPPVFSSVNNPDSICGNQTIFLQASPSGGVFSGPGVVNDLFIASLVNTGNSYTLNYSYTDSTGCSSLPVPFTVYVASCAGLTDLEAIMPRIAPNPARESLEINQGEKCYFDRLEISDLEGRVLEVKNLTQNVSQLSVANLSAGTYIFRFIDSGKLVSSVSSRIVIQQ
jgi:FG-GAP-like repeat/Secretion system C-terminal sorting domain